MPLTVPDPTIRPPASPPAPVGSIGSTALRAAPAPLAVLRAAPFAAPALRPALLAALLAAACGGPAPSSEAADAGGGGAATGAAAEPAILRPGDPLLDAGTLAPHTDSMRIWFVRDGEERPGALQVEALWTESDTEGPVLAQALHVVSSRGTLADTTWYRLPGLAPLRHRSHGAAFGARDLSLDYADGGRRLEGRVEHRDSAAVPLERAWPQPLFDPGASHLVVRSLPLEPGFARRVPFFDHEALELRWSRLEVLEPGDPGTDGVPAEVTVVRQVLPDGRNVFLWIAGDDRRVVEVRAPLPDGSEMRSRPPGAG